MFRPRLVIFSVFLTGSYLDPMSEQKNSQQCVTSCFVMTQVNQAVTVLNLFSSADELLTKTPNLEDFWKLETIGIGDPLDLTDDDRALEQFNKSVCFKDGRYHHGSVKILIFQKILTLL